MTGNPYEQIPRVMDRGFCEICKNKSQPILTIGQTAWDDGEDIGICYECSHELWIKHTSKTIHQRIAARDKKLESHNGSAADL